MTYLAILGRQPELGRAELEASGAKLTVFGNHALTTSKLNLDYLGGTIKLARVIGETAGSNLILPQLEPALAETKNNFGISAYGFKVTPARLKALGLELKKRLPGKWRLVATKDTALTAAQLLHNKIPASGFELIMATDGQKTVFALTEQVQDIAWYAQRDYDKPVRDSQIGMLPPKLAQIIINLAGASGHPVWDPFCGTGTVLAEALLCGLTTYGSDINPAMVEASSSNLEWLNQQRPSLPQYFITQGDALLASPPHADCVLASEGYLGPALHSLPSDVQALRGELNTFYVKFLTNLAPHSQPGRGLCLCLPAWKGSSGFITLPLVDQLTDMGYALRRFMTADSSRLIYHRPGQIVGRQLLSLRKI